MGRTAKAPTLSAFMFLAATFALSLYFVFAALQGDFGLFRRIQIEAEADALDAQLGELRTEVAAMQNKTRRLSDDYLDLDLLDERAREVLGMVRPDELVVN